MKPPKQNAYVSLIGTILIMWLMVGYVYLLTPLDTLPSSSAAEEAVSLQHASAAGALPSSDHAGESRLTLKTVKDRYRPREPVVVLAHLSGLPRKTVDATLSSLLIEGDIQVLGPVTFARDDATGDYVSRITLNPSTGLPLAKGSYKVVVQVGVDLVAAVSFEVAATVGQVAFQP